MLAKISQVLNGPEDVLIDKFRIEIHRKDIMTLQDTRWLNDEIINFYFKLMQQRSEDNSAEFPKVFAFNSFFFTKLQREGYNGVKRWTKTVLT